MIPEQAVAREYIIGKCVHLAVGEEVTFDRRAVQVAFPAALGGRSRSQILEELAMVGEGVSSAAAISRPAISSSRGMIRRALEAELD